jgi:predicted PurR-regulated permease PerM
MALNRFYFISLSAIFLLLGYLSYNIFRPFLSPIAWAVVLSIVFYPLYAFLLKYIKLRSISSLIVLILIIVLISGPVSYLSVLLVKELKIISNYVEGEGFKSVQGLLQHKYVRSLIMKITSLMEITEDELNKAIADNISKIGKQLISRVTTGVADIFTGLLNFIFMIFTVFFLLKDGTVFLSKIKDYMPFSEEQKDRLTTQIRDIIISTLYGGVVVALVQGTMAGLAFYFLDVPSPVVWGLATSIASFIPLIGAAAVWAPAAGYLFLTGAFVKGLILAIIGFFGISLIDNVLKPIIIGGRTKMPILIIFFSVLGGIKLFGLIGLIMGPLVIALFVSVIEIFRNIEGGQNA